MQASESGPNYIYFKATLSKFEAKPVLTEKLHKRIFGKWVIYPLKFFQILTLQLSYWDAEYILALKEPKIFQNRLWCITFQSGDALPTVGG